MTLTQKINHVAEALENFIERFKNKPKLAAWLTSYINQIQDLEDVFWEIVTERCLDDAVGEQLDGLGEIVGESREGRDDDTYRVAIRARRLLNQSQGTPEELMTIVSASIDFLSDVRIKEYYPAALTAEVVDPFPSGYDPAQIGDILRKGKPAGVKAHLLAHPADPFQFDTGFGYDEGHYGGAW